MISVVFRAVPAVLRWVCGGLRGVSRGPREVPNDLRGFSRGIMRSQRRSRGFEGRLSLRLLGVFQEVSGSFKEHHEISEAFQGGLRWFQGVPCSFRAFKEVSGVAGGLKGVS